MKKFTLVLASLFLALGTMTAQETYVTDLNDLSNEKVYFIESARCFLLNSANYADGVATSNGGAVGTVARDFNNEDQQFKIEKDGDNYYLYSVTAGKYVTTDGNWSDAKETALVIENVGGDYPWKMCIGNQGMNTQTKGQTASGIMVNGWTTTDAGNSFRILDVAASTPVIIDYPNELTEFNPNKCYTATVTQRGGWAVNNEGQFVSYSQAGEVADANKQFAVLSADNENYYLFSVGANAFVKKDGTTVQGIADPIVLHDASAEGECRVLVQFKDYSDGYININGVNNMDICGWNAVDHGNAIAFIEAGDFNPEAALAMLFVSPDTELAELIAEYEAMGIVAGTNIGDFTAASVEAFEAALATAKAVTEATEADVEALQAAYDALAINLPATNKVYAFNVYYNGFGTYMYSKIDGSSTNIYTRGESKDDTKALWQFVAVEGGYNIKNVHTGLFIGEGVTMTDNANNYALFEVTKTNVENGTSISAEEGKVFIKFAGETNYNCLHSYNRETVISWQGSGLGNQIGIEEVSEFSHTLTVSAAGYATLVLGFNATIPAGAECYYAAEAIDANGILNLTQVEGNVLPANTPVIVKAAANDYEFAYTTEAGNAPAANLLSGTLYTKVVTPAGTAYVLANGVNGIGLYKAELTSFIDNTGTGQTVGVANSFQNNANKVYLDAAASTAASYSFNFDWAGTTGVEGVVAEGAENGAIYDITGRRVKAITAPGLYIINGVKVVK